MTAQEILTRARAREGDIEDDRQTVVTAVHELVDAGDTRAALELVARAWTMWLSSSDMDGGWAEAQVRFERGSRDLEKLGVVLDPDDKLELDWLRGRLAGRG
jgi:hypothetical protein